MPRLAGGTPAYAAVALSIGAISFGVVYWAGERPNAGRLLGNSYLLYPCHLVLSSVRMHRGREKAPVVVGAGRV